MENDAKVAVACQTLPQHETSSTCYLIGMLSSMNCCVLALERVPRWAEGYDHNIVGILSRPIIWQNTKMISMVSIFLKGFRAES